MTLVAVAAPAKINLHLHVVGRRPDGYHEIESLIAFALVHDRLTLRPAAGFSLTVEGPFAAALADAGEDNLVLRAARALASALGRTDGAAMTLTKCLPVAAGIGGGSADAAACLLALARLWAVPDGAVDWSSLTAGLGADVPACLGARPVLATGVGERLTPVPLPDLIPIVLVNPGVAVRTVAVFRRLRGPFRTPAGAAPEVATPAALAVWLDARGNDLTAAAIAIAPEIETVLTRLAAAPGARTARLSGSGATCFALFEDAAHAAHAAAALVRERPDWWVAQSWLAADARATLR